ncbi:unnamed protein product [Rotaria magnacalcarata]|nr:unnamed protein product [Rotaria magnacalcarata]
MFSSQVSSSSVDLKIEDAVTEVEFDCIVSNGGIIDATHLATKWRNRLLSSTVELRLGDQSISINHLYSIIDNGKFTKIDDGLTKSDINPKDRQNFSSCVKLASDDLF